MRVVYSEPRSVLPMHRHPGARLVLVLSGNVNESEVGGRHVYRAGDFIFRPPYYLHANDACDDHAEYVRFNLSRTTWLSFVAQHGWRSARGRFDVNEAPSFLTGQCAGDRLLRNGIPETAVTQPAGDQTDVLYEIASSLRGSAGPSPRFEEQAEKIGLRPYQLTRAFIRRFGLTPCAYRREARLQRAIRLLTDARLKLAEVAVESGYADQSHMTREMSAVAGVTPAAMQRSLAAG